MCWCVGAVVHDVVYVFVRDLQVSALFLCEVALAV